MHGKSIPVIGAPVPAADAVPPRASTPTAPSQLRRDVGKAHIEVPAPAAAEDEALATRLAGLVNAVYREAEDGIFKAPFERTTTAEVRDLLRAGGLAVAFLPPADGGQCAAGRRPAGCVYIRRASPTTGEFGMLAVDPECRGAGLGLALVRFAEDRCRSHLGLRAVRLELLAPVHFEHPGKTRLQAWYTGLGYAMTELADFGEAYPRLSVLLSGPSEYRVFERSLIA
ncbi:hypothetical protein F4802DRAFT_566919 [Xylaria palmicola]|nr:hypothetical protein F4802DRAFT_566919 [Xylaria palmicola]